MCISASPDNAAQETEVTMQRVQELIADPDVKVLIFCQAVVGAKAAVEKARETRDDILSVSYTHLDVYKRQD